MTVERALVVEALPAYEIGGEIGRGGWGLVLEGRHRQLGREVAIKQLPRAFAADPDVRSRFVAEARLLASLDHPHIVPVYDFVERDGLCLIVMEKLIGGTVWDRYTRRETSPEMAAGIGVASALALHHAHQRGILHRDVKPENLMFSAGGMLKVTDFGIAKVLTGGRSLATRAGDVLGTPAYMAPEQALGADTTSATDIYALGVVMYELLAGRLPFEEGSNAMAVLYRHVNDEPPPITSIAPVPGPLAAAVMRALHKDPRERYDDAEAFALELTRCANAAFGSGWLREARIVVSAGGALDPVISGGSASAVHPAAMPTSLRELSDALLRAAMPETWQVASEVERLQSGLHEVRELRLLQQHRSGASPFREQDWPEVERLLGAYGTTPAQRLGVDDHAGVTDLRVAAHEALSRWQRRAESPLSSREHSSAARVLVRTCEGLLTQLGH